MKKSRDHTFEEWASAHRYADQVQNFFEWVEEMEELDTGKSLNRQRRFELEESIMYLDALSNRMQRAGILKESIFKSNQFLNADKLMRAAKKSGLINQVLADVSMGDRPETEENMWFAMRLYSIFLDFYKLTPEESAACQYILDDLHLPEKIVKRLYILWGCFGALLVLLAVVSVTLLVVLGNITFAIIMAVLMVLGILAFTFFGLFQSLPFQFKRRMKDVELYCVRGQVCDIGTGEPFVSSSYSTQAIQVSTLHDSLGKLFTFYAINPLTLRADGSAYQIIYIKGMNVALEALPIAPKQALSEERSQKVEQEV